MNVSQLKPCTNAQLALRNIAKQMDSGEIEDEEVTIIVGTEVFHVGCWDDSRAAEGAIFNMTMGIHKLMQPVIDYATDKS